ncbi:MAG: hypothetical protein IJD86_11080, partial [Clostridia bacterium]|nr:hypothetical protein [Clostridia bacterium]
REHGSGAAGASRAGVPHKSERRTDGTVTGTAGHQRECVLTAGKEAVSPFAEAAKQGGTAGKCFSRPCA